MCVRHVHFSDHRKLGTDKPSLNINDFLNIFEAHESIGEGEPKTMHTHAASLHQAVVKGVFA